MFELYFTDGDAYEKLNEILPKYICITYKIARTENGKPYIEGNPLYFSISHSRGKSVIAVDANPVGVDMEVIEDRKYSALLSRFSPEERAEITCLTDFLKHWVVREAYIKMSGATLAHKLDKLKYVNGVLYDGGKPADCRFYNFTDGGCIICVCIDKKCGIC